MSRSRRTRPSLDRTQPVRSFSGVLGAAATAGAATAAAPGDGAPRPRVEEAVSRSVELGYRVIDDYIRQGQRAAQRLGAGQLTAEVVASEVNDLGARIARYASDFFGAWMELLELAAAGSAARQAGNGAPTAAAAPAAASAERRPPTALRVEVIASRPVHVETDFRGDRVTGAVRAHDLRSADPKKPRLGDVEVLTDGPAGAAVLRVRVPDDHPDGTYDGLLIDAATNRPVGAVRVVVSPEPRAAPGPRARPPRRQPRGRTGRARR